MMELQKRRKRKKESKVIPKVSSVGEELFHLEKDRSIRTDPSDSRKRRTIKLVKLSASWGFTLQTYGICHKKTSEIEVTTYVDYVELEGPAWIAGMRRGDVILSVNGESVEHTTHQQLVERIQTSGKHMRLVVLFEDCCRKVELHDRYIRLKKVLAEKKRELMVLEEKERLILQGVTRFEDMRLSMRSSASSLDSSLDFYTMSGHPSMLNLPTTSRFHYPSSVLESDTTGSCCSEISIDSDNGNFSCVEDMESDTNSFTSSLFSSGLHESMEHTILENGEHSPTATDISGDFFHKQETPTTAEFSVCMSRKRAETVCKREPLANGESSEHINEKDEVTRL